MSSLLSSGIVSCFRDVSINRYATISKCIVDIKGNKTKPKLRLEKMKNRSWNNFQERQDVDLDLSAQPGEKIVFNHLVQ